MTALAFVTLSAPGTSDAADNFAFFHENVLGTSLELRVRADSPGDAGRAEARVLAEIDRLAKVFSGYDPSSEFSRWQNTFRVPSKVSFELLAVLKASDHWREFTAGAFDPRVQALSTLWSDASKRGRTPTPDEVAGAMARMAPPAWKLVERLGTAERTSDCPLTFNAIAKGYIVDAACEAALDPFRGVLGVMVCIGGDLRVCGDYARKIGVADPRRDSETTEPLSTVELRGRSLASSGGYQRGYRVGASWYSHIMHPRAGAPAGHVLGSTVIAGRAADADALATAFSVLTPEESLARADALPGVACLVVTDAGRVFRSKAWRGYESARPLRVSYARASPERTSWGDEFEVSVRFEVKGPDANPGRYRRPYVAVWVEDKDGVPVRTLTLWVQKNGPGPRWIPDLKRWYRGDQMRKLVDEADLVQTVSRATRPPGKYEVVWDGKDDHGKPLDAGDYTLSIEAAREHGTYQVIRKPLTVGGGGKPFSEELKGNAEIKSASVEYRRARVAK